MAACRPIWWPSANTCGAEGHACDAINLTRFRREDADGVYYPSSAIALMRLLWRSAGRHSASALRRRSDAPIAGAGAVLHACCPGARRCLRSIPADIRGRRRDGRRRRGTLRGFVLRRLDGLIGVNAEIAALFAKFGVTPGTHPHDPAVCGAAAGSLAAAAGTAGGVPERAQSGAADGGPAGAGIRFADADRRDGWNSASATRGPGC